MRYGTGLLALPVASPAFAQVSPETVGAGIGFVAGMIMAILIGAVIGWLASLIVTGSGSGLLTDILAGVGGSMLASYLLPRFGITLGGGWVGAFLAALAGAVLILVVLRLVRRA